MIRYNLSEAKAKFSAVMESVEAGNSVTLCKRNQPVATLQPLPRSPSTTSQRHHTRIGWASGTIRIHDDLEKPALPSSDWEMLS
ncbi:MAG: type II toxin-antitoxin system prevent-host-death family antitoxin [Kiritimatiellia bacterium]